MKNISTALLNLLNTSNVFLMCDLYTITPVAGMGPVLTYSSADTPLTYNIPAQTVAGGLPYNPIGGMRLKRGTMRTVVGMQVDKIDVTLFPTINDTINGNPVAFEVMNGTLDGAWVSIDRAFLTTWQSAGIVGTINLFAGRVSDCSIGRTAVTMTVKSPVELLDINFPRNVYQPGCLHNLFDTGCTLLASAFAISGSVGTGPASNSILVTPGYGDGYFQLGYLTFTSGVLAGQTRSLTYYQSSTGLVYFASPFPTAPAVGDTYLMYPGCDHQQVTCQTKFNNLPNFRGQPYIPQPETAV